MDRMQRIVEVRTHVSSVFEPSPLTKSINHVFDRVLEHTGGLKSIGKAVTKGTKQIGKTLTAISDSPDRRGRGRLQMVQHKQPSTPSGESRNALPTPTSGKPLGLEIGTSGFALFLFTLSSVS
jgi:hypothetical protein